MLHIAVGESPDNIPKWLVHKPDPDEWLDKHHVDICRQAGGFPRAAILEERTVWISTDFDRSTDILSAVDSLVSRFGRKRTRVFVKQILDALE